jgi:hypothetical protein
MAKKKSLGILGMVVDNTDTSHEINSLVVLVVIQIGTNLMGSVAINPFKS